MLSEIQTKNYETDLRTIALKDGFTAAGHSINWTEVGMLTQCKDIVWSEDRLERSRHFGDDDYDQHVLNVLERIVERDSRNELKLVKYALSNLTGHHFADSPVRGRLEKIADYLKVIKVIGGDDLSDHPNVVDHYNRIEQTMFDDPQAAIGHSKDLVESALKTFLRMPADGPKKYDMPQLIKAVRDEISKGLGNLEHDKELVKMLSNFGQIMESIATVRNKHGTGHGRGPEETFDLPQPYVVLAANSAISAAVFLTQMHDLKTPEPEDSFKAENSEENLDDGEDLPW